MYKLLKKKDDICDCKKSKKCYFYLKGFFLFKIFSENFFVIKIKKNVC